MGTWVARKRVETEMEEGKMRIPTDSQWGKLGKA